MLRRRAAGLSRRGTADLGRRRSASAGGAHPRARQPNESATQAGGTVTAEPRRRALLAATAALPVLAAGCRGVGALAAPPRPAPDVALLRAVISAEELMVARYAEAVRLAGAGATAGRAGGREFHALLAALLGQHRAHLAALKGRLIVPAGSPYPPPRRSGPAPALPAARHKLAARLSAAEHAASARLAGQLLDAPPALAELLASISAAEATHVLALRAGRHG
jgi:hypothetical protein